MIRWTTPVTALALCAGPAFASEMPPRCALLGQVGTSTFMSLATALWERDEPGIDRNLNRFSDLSGSYQTLGCDMGALGATLDCVLETAGAAEPTVVAYNCLADAGLATR